MKQVRSHAESVLSRHRDVWVCLFLAAAVLAVYWRAQSYDFVSYDDPVYVSANPHVQAGLTRESIRSAFTTVPGGFWIPLTWLSYMLDSDLYGVDPGGYHLTNVLFHLANVLLLFFVIKRMTRAFWQSAFVAALFALHPIHVESVAWITERKDVLSTFFWMLSLLAYAHYTEGPSVKRYAPVFLFMGLGLMAKPMLVTLPFALLLLDYWPLGRFPFSPWLAPENWRASKASTRYLLWEKAPLLLLSAASSIITLYAQRTVSAVVAVDRISPSIRILNALVSYVGYLGKMIWPQHLAVLYPHPGNSLPMWQAGLAGVIVLCLSIVIIGLRRKYPFLMVGWLWYLGTLVPVSGVAQAGGQAMADRFAYVPLMGVYIMIAWGVPHFLAQWRYAQQVLVAGAVALMSVLMVTTWLQVRYWANSVTLFGRAVDVTENNYVAHLNLGVALAGQGRTHEAIEQYKQALRISPQYAGTYSNMGAALATLGRIDEAMEYYRKALKKDPNYVDAHNNLGLALAEQGKIAEAIQHFKAALRINPSFAEAHNNLGNALVFAGNIEQAIGHFQRALDIRSSYAKAKHNLKLALEALNKKKR